MILMRPPVPTTAALHPAASHLDRIERESDTPMQEHAYPPSPTGFPSQSSDGSASLAHDPAAATTRTSSQCSSQESQLLHLSRIASMQEKLDDGDAVSRKRTAEGLVKDAPRGHSRTTSSVSMASTSGSRIGEVTSELRTRLSYAMVKVNHGWQGHSIDEVESLASQAASPTSSTSTIPTRLSTSPALSQGIARVSFNGHHATPPASQSQSHSSYDSTADARSPVRGNGTKRAALAPPAPIQPGQSFPSHDRRPSKAGYTPTPLSHSHTASPQTPALYTYPNSQPTPRDPILFSPHQTDRDRDAIEALVSMGSPATNLPRVFSPSSSAPARTRHALPTGQPRKSLPSGRPHEAEPRRRVGGGVAPLRSSLSMPAALGSGVGRRLRDEEIERMLERAAEESSEDEEEILIPRLRGVVGSG